MAKPSGITTGDGTEAHPWEVHNYDEIKWACEDAGAIPSGQTINSDYVYILLVNDIDCKSYDATFTWYIALTHSIHLDLGTHTIKTFYIQKSTYMFVNAATVACDYYVGNGNILNVYGNPDGGSAGLFAMGTAHSHTSVIDNISFSIDLTRISVIAQQNMADNSIYIIKNCAFWLQGDRTSETITIDRSKLFDFCGSMNCCDFYFNDLSVFNAHILFGSATVLTTLSNCRFQGTYTYDSDASTSYVLFAYATTVNCVIDATFETLHGQLIWCSNDAAASGIYNETKIPTTLRLPNKLIACLPSDMDMRVNPNANLRLDDLGFPVTKG